MKKKCAFPIFMTVFFLLPALLRSQEGPAFDSLTLLRLDSAIRNEMWRQDIIGMSVGIIYDGEISFLGAYGYSDWENRVPVTLDSEFRWASMAKSLTTVAAMKLQEQGLLDLEDHARAYVPSWPDSTVRVRHLLANRSGIGHYDELDRVFPAWKKNLRDIYPKDSVWSAEKAVLVFKDAPLIFPPDSAYKYSTFGFVLAGAVLESIGKKRLGLGYLDLVDQYIRRPLGLVSLKPDYLWGANPQEVKGYYRDRIGDIRPRTDDDVSWKIPGGGYQSNISDLSKYVKSLIFRDLLQPASYEKIWARQLEWDYGLGFEIKGAGVDLCVAHSGSQNKTRTIFVCYPNRGVGVAVMCNTEWASPRAVADAVLQRLLNKEGPVEGAFSGEGR
ncbi:MAG: serine hydrolase domain-containing protein [Saprospiraceae bacterium]